MLNAPAPEPFFLIVADVEHGFFCIEGPMTDDRPWTDAAVHARSHGRAIECGPAGPDRDALATDYRRTRNLAGVPPGSILRIVGLRR
jgi:hypothetical protein